MIQITRIFSDSNGETHFADMPLQALGEILSEGKIEVKVESMIYRETVGENRGWHCAPQKQFVVLLDGEVEVTVSDGSVRRFHSGSIILAEDTNGKGHQTKVISQGKRRSLFLPC